MQAADLRRRAAELRSCAHRGGTLATALGSALKADLKARTAELIVFSGGPTVRRAP